MEFAGKRINADNPYAINPISLEGNSLLYVRFFKPDGTILKKTASARDADSLEDTEIVYEEDDGDGDGESILDIIGKWEYTVGAEYTDGSIIESPIHDIFWVVQ